MQDPREIAWQSRCDDHSHNNAIRVAFTAIYTRAIPNARLGQYYKSKHPSVQQWVTAKLELENALIVAEEVGQAGGRQDQDMPDADTGLDGAVMRVRGVNGRPTLEKRKTPPAKDGAVMRVRGVNGRFTLEERKTPPANATRGAKVAGGIKAVVGMKVKKRSELEVLFSTMGQGMRSSGVITVPDNENGITGGAGGDTITEDNPLVPAPPISSVEQTSAELPQLTKKPRMGPASSNKTVPNTKTKRTLKPRTTTSSPSIAVAPRHTKTTPKPSTKKLTSGVNEKKAEQTEPNTKTTPQTTSKYSTFGLSSQSLTNYDILPHIPGITEVIYDRYPVLHAQPKRRADEAARARLDTGRLVLMCMKAAGREDAAKAGVENSVVGWTGGLVFLRRNVVRVKRRMGIGR